MGPQRTTVRCAVYEVPTIAPPIDTNFPHSAIVYSIDGIASGASTEVKFVLHGSPQVMAVFRHAMSAQIDALYEVVGSEVQIDRVIIPLRDGDTGDLDAVTDGRFGDEIVMAGTSRVWPNQRDVFDVENQNGVTSLDTLLIINRLNKENSKLPAINTESNRYYDVNGDGFLTALNALAVINQLGKTPASLELPSAEGEQPLLPPSPGQVDFAIQAILQEANDHRRERSQPTQRERSFSGKAGQARGFLVGFPLGEGKKR